MEVVVMGWDWVTIGGILTVLTILGGIWHKWVLPFLRRIGYFLEDWNGEPPRPGVPARPGVLEQLAGVQSEQARVSKELQTNGGSSIKDAVKRTEAGLSQVQTEQRAQRATLDTLAALVGAFIGREQVARLEGHKAQAELFRTMQEINGEEGHQ
jgi:hypothetical protein